MIFLHIIRHNTYICQIKSHTKKKVKFHPFSCGRDFLLWEGFVTPILQGVGFLLWEARNDFVAQFLLDSDTYSKTYFYILKACKANGTRSVPATFSVHESVSYMIALWTIKYCGHETIAYM